MRQVQRIDRRGMMVVVNDPKLAYSSAELYFLPHHLRRDKALARYDSRMLSEVATL